MSSEYQHELRNWWCPKCRKWLPSCDLDATERHRKCQTKAEWWEFTVTCFDVKPLRAQDART